MVCERGIEDVDPELELEVLVFDNRVNDDDDEEEVDAERSPAWS